MQSKHSDQEIVDKYKEFCASDVILYLKIGSSRLKSACTRLSYEKPKELEIEHKKAATARRVTQMVQTRKAEGTYAATPEVKHKISTTAKDNIAKGKTKSYFRENPGEASKKLHSTPALREKWEKSQQLSTAIKRAKSWGRVEPLLSQGCSVSEVATLLEIGEAQVRSLCRREKDFENGVVLDSALEAEFSKLFPQFIPHYSISSRSVGSEVDFFNEEHKVAVEINGLYWHSSLRKEPKAHQDLSKKCRQLGIRLIHIYEHEWRHKNEIIISLIRASLREFEERFYARGLTLQEVPKDQAKIFLNKNHLQGYRAAKFTYGLYLKDKLIQLMSFSFNNKYNSYEVIRAATALNTQVVGGVSKLLSHFKALHNPLEIISYCDFNKFDGKGYVTSGFVEQSLTVPDMHWILDLSKAVVVNRNPSKHKELKALAIAQLFGAGSLLYKKSWK